MYEERLETDRHRDIMFVITQNYFFQFSEGLTVKELAERTDISEGTVRKIAKELLDLSLIEQKGKRPAFYKIAPSYFESR